MEERVLSVQSHVAFGYVGGKAAAFPLQCLGYDVDLVNTVNFSNHAGYGRSGGSKTSAAELDSIFEAMEYNELLRPTRLLTGYIPDAEALTAVSRLAENLRKKKPELIYLLDPVMGDAGRLYVAADVVPVYRNLLPHSTIITPNWFEVEILTEISLTSVSALRRALIKLHKDFGVPNVAISSIPLTPWLSESLPSVIRPPADSESEHLLCITSSSISNDVQPSEVHAQCVPLLPGYFSGVGDLFSSLVLAHYKPSNASSLSSVFPPSQMPFSDAVSQALTKTHAVLSKTFEYSGLLPEEERSVTDDEKDAVEPIRKVRRMRGRELRLVQSIDIIRGDFGNSMRRLQSWSGFWEH
ncbi:Ribokinase-like protein [Lentinula aciculospora]|uniref:pyridoxal kinase n=1 Tax=Lentinula aciculospora TaxID=153920 RepID=A0A9W9DL72_9AGAR|nr:Ribokinase-like protein [Lentinula aciculospora]